MANSSQRTPIAPAMTALVLLSASCVRLDENHCIVNGGDFACDEARMCVTEIEEIREPSDRGDGCILIEGIDTYDFDAYFVHVKYGLPDSLRASTDDASEDVQSLTGVLVRAAEAHEVTDVDECVVSESVVLQFEEEWLEVKAVHTFLDQRDRIRVESAALEPFHVEAIRRLNDAIDGWLEGCIEDE